MSTTVQKWGNSLGVRLSRPLADKFKLRKGSIVEVVSDADFIIIKPEMTPVESLDEMVKKINAKNKHKKVEWGRARGKELWL
ncbi:MAG TPA: AbrB/MazE/SpoVT family DNA-binding domain-containing protein [Candidatus Paceibacterota bacterium]